MPDYSRQGKHYFISYITGPSHVRLGLAISNIPDIEPQLIKGNSIGSCEHSKLDEEQIKQAVLDGIADANSELGINCYASEIIYTANDSPRYALFRRCAALIIKYYYNFFEMQQ